MSLNILLMRPYSAIQKVIPIGLLCLSSHLKKAYPDVKVKLIDFRMRGSKDYSELRSLLPGFVPDVVGITSLSMEISEAVALAEHSRTEFPHAVHVVGGPGPTVVYDDIDASGVFDRIVVGEGEEVFSAIVGGTVDAAKRILFASEFPPVNVDYMLKPDYSLINLHDYFIRDSHEAFQRHRKYVPIFTSRGCPFDCGFCFHIFGKSVRFRDITHVCLEVEYLVKTYGIEEIHIEDDVFNLDKKRASQFFDFLKAKGIQLSVSFPNGIIYDNIDDDFVRLLSSNGVYRVCLGVESTAPHIMKLISKQHDVAKLADVIKLLDKHKILTHAFLITGFPTETEDDLRATIKFLLSSRLHTFRFGRYVPFRGTPLYQKFNHLFQDQDFRSEHYGRYHHEKFHSEIEESKIIYLIRSATLKFYLNPFRIYRTLLAVNNKVLFRILFKKARHFLLMSGRN